MKPASCVASIGVSLAVVAMVTACGVVGSPVAPEKVGVNPTITRQKMQLQKTGAVQPGDNASEEPVSIEPMELKGQDQELPPLRPVGAR